MFIQPKYKEKAVGCMNGFCLHIGPFGFGDRRKVAAVKEMPSTKKSGKKKAKPSMDSGIWCQEEEQMKPQQCPAMNLFLPAEPDSTYPGDCEALAAELEATIRNGQTAIGQLEQLRARKNVLGEIQEAFERNWEAEEKNEGGSNFLNKFIGQLKAQYELARQIEKIVPSVLEELCSDCLHNEEKLSSERLFSKNFAKLLDIAIRFDALKAATPELQNGFSLYRRMNLLKNFGACGGQQQERILYAHLGDQIALFLSRPTPLLISVVNGAERFIGRQQSRELAISHLTEAILVIYNVLKHTIERRRQFSSHRGGDLAKLGQRGCCPAVGDFLMRAMVGCLLLFDHVQRAPGGVFCCSKSPFDVVEFAAMVKRDANVEKATQHLSALQFMSRHFNDAETPSHVRRMFNC